MELIIKILKFILDIRIELLNITLLYLLACYFCWFIKYRISRNIIASLIAMFLCLQFISLYFVQSFIGYQFYVHFNIRDISEMLFIYWKQIIFLIFIFLIIYLSLVKIKNITSTLKGFLKKKKPRFLKISLSKYFKFSFIIFILIKRKS